MSQRFIIFLCLLLVFVKAIECQFDSTLYDTFPGKAPNNHNSKT